MVRLSCLERQTLLLGVVHVSAFAALEKRVVRCGQRVVIQIAFDVVFVNVHININSFGFALGKVFRFVYYDIKRCVLLFLERTMMIRILYHIIYVYVFVLCCYVDYDA